MPTQRTDHLSEVFAALANPVRRDILSRLRSGRMSVGELAASYAMSGPAITQHLNVLEKAGLIVRETRKQWRDCVVTDRGLDEAAEWIERHRAEWNERFDLLEDRLATKKESQQ